MSEARNLLVTGGSRGIGAAIARAAAGAGWNVAINYVRDETAAQRLVAEIRALGRRALAVRADVAIPEDIEAMFATLDRDFGRIDDLANNAGIVGRASPLTEADPQTIVRVIATNLTGAMLVAREAARRMSSRYGGRGGAIVNVSSSAATLGSPGEFVWYAASKGGVDTMTIGLAKELGPQGIRVNSVQPGLIETEIHASAGAADRIFRLGPEVPLGRTGRPEEVARTVLFLLSQDASYVSGAILRIGGGR